VRRPPRLQALPVLVAAFAALTALYLVQAWTHHSPWIFFDELDYAWNSRKIAALRTEPGAKAWRFEGLYPLAIAPAWLVDDLHTGYAVAKAIGTVAMTATVFLAYWLARSIGAARLPAVFAAVATVTVAAMSYTSTLMTETLAYPYATLCFALFVRALSVRTRGWILSAVVAAALAPLVRKELAVLPAALAVAGVAMAVIPRLGRSWPRWLLALVAAGVVLGILAWALKSASTTWAVAADHPLRMVQYGRRGVAAVVVGVAILPAIVATAVLVPRRGEAADPRLRAFAYVFWASAATLVLYTSAKAAYYGAAGHPVEERNLIYLAPLLFAGTAVWLTMRRARLAALVAAAAVAFALVVTVPLHFDSLVPASDAPSLEVLFSLRWSSSALHVLLAAACIASLLVAFLLPRARKAAVVVCVLVLCWTLGSEIYASNRSAAYARVLAASLPRPFEWIDRATHDRPALYVGQQIRQPTDIWLLSFWNRSLVRMRSLDGTPRATHPLPGNADKRGLGDILRIKVGRNGALPAPHGVRFLVADEGIEGSGHPLGLGKRWRVYRGTRLQASASGVSADGWAGARTVYSVYSGVPGKVSVVLSRKAFCGKDVPGRARLTVGGKLVGEGVVHACRTAHLTSPVLVPPLNTILTIHPTFSPAALDPSSTDTRQLGAQVNYSFIPDGTP
jgi:hypothetical protein